MRPHEDLRDEIVGITEETPYKIIKRGKSWAMHNHPDPCSIAPVEFVHLRNFVKENKLQRGYEVATAFGISALAIGQGMKEHGGRLVSMDAYIEEQFNGCMDYNNPTMMRRTYKDADGFKTAAFLMQHYDLENTVKLTVGLSPKDTSKVIKDMFGDQKLDFVFIDALHTDEAVLKDLHVVLPFLAEKHVVFFHDVHCFSRATKQQVKNMLKKEWTVVPKCEHPGHGFNMAVVNNL